MGNCLRYQKALFSAEATTSGIHTSVVGDILDSRAYCVGVSWRVSGYDTTGLVASGLTAPAGTVKLQGACIQESKFGMSTTRLSEENWSRIPTYYFVDISGATVTVSGNYGAGIINVDGAHYTHVRAIFTSANAGTATLDVVLASKKNI